MPYPEQPWHDRTRSASILALLLDLEALVIAILLVRDVLAWH
jgi:hypothetical protein